MRSNSNYIDYFVKIIWNICVSWHEHLSIAWNYWNHWKNWGRILKTEGTAMPLLKAKSRRHYLSKSLNLCFMSSVKKKTKQTWGCKPQTTRGTHCIGNINIWQNTEFTQSPVSQTLLVTLPWSKCMTVHWLLQSTIIYWTLNIIPLAFSLQICSVQIFIFYSSTLTSKLWYKKWQYHLVPTWIPLS